MRSFASLTTLIIFVWLRLQCQVHFVVGSGPDTLPALPVYDFSMSNCSLFRNETVLRPMFGVWPEVIKGVPFRYCCEYQPNGASSTFELSKYTYSPGGGSLQPAPYYDLGIVDKDHFAYYWRYWRFWTLPEKLNSAPLLYCDVTDLRELHLYRNWNKVLVRGFLTWAVIVGPLAILVSVLLVIGSKCDVGIYKASYREDGGPPVTPSPSLETEEAFADACHILMLALVGSSLLEGIAHSPLRSWRSELMFNGAVVYVYLTLLATISTFIRHCLVLELRIWESARDSGWLWQKAFAQFVAYFMVATYLVLVEDVTEHSLDAVSSLALGTCAAASVWSGGVEIVVVVRFCWLKLIRPNLFVHKFNSFPSDAISNRLPYTNQN